MIGQEARKNLLTFSQVVDPTYMANWHHALIAEKLEEAYEKIQRGERVRIMITVPPRHGKSRLATQLFPAWALGKDPTLPIMVTSYSADLASKFGQLTKDVIINEKYNFIFPKSKLRRDAKSKSDWKLTEGGAYHAVGVGGSLTGLGAKLAVIDDPVKNREEAESSTMRNKVYDWYTSTLYTRLQGHGAVIIIMCMTGDTKVLMADGTEKELKDINIGDEVATYKDGRLCKSNVKNWCSNGYDSVFKITTSSGKIVRANKRHPFLVYENNKLVWKRIKNLTTVHKIVTLKDSGVSGKERNVPLRDVKEMPIAEGIVRHTTTKRNGQTDIGHHLSTRRQEEQPALNIGMVLLWKNIKKCLKHKKDYVQYVATLRQKMLELIGEVSFALTTVIQQARLGASCATIVTSLLDILRMRKPLSPLSNTSDFTLDQIVSIEQTGDEEVFDLQVEETENFIANGVVSHNTRWHDDDLAGKLLYEDEQRKERGEQTEDWDVIKFPAVATHEEYYKDELVRVEGDPLWPQYYSKEKLMLTKDTAGLYDWASLYQQDPVLAETQEFKESMFKVYKEEDLRDKALQYYTFVDPAISQKEASDNTVVLTIGKELNGPNWYRIREDAGHYTPGQTVDLIFKHWQTYRSEVFLETVAYQQALKYSVEEEQRQRQQYFMVNDVKTTSNKEVRIRGLIPLYERGVIYHKHNDKEYELELLTFPRGRRDDRCDAMAMGLDAIQNTEYTGQAKTKKPHWKKYGRLFRK